jgi:hypothetical protein
MTDYFNIANETLNRVYNEEITQEQALQIFLHILENANTPTTRRIAIDGIFYNNFCSEEYYDKLLNFAISDEDCVIRQKAHDCIWKYFKYRYKELLEYSINIEPYFHILGDAVKRRRELYGITPNNYTKFNKIVIK